MCMIDGVDESPAVSRTTHPTAKKSRSCTECRRVITIGERYRYTNMLFDGAWDNYSTCAHCLVGASWLIENCGGFVHHGVCEDLEEHTSEYPDIAFGVYRLIVGMRRQWRLGRKGADGLMPIPAMPRSIGYAMKMVEIRALRRVAHEHAEPGRWADDGGPV